MTNTNRRQAAPDASDFSLGYSRPRPSNIMATQHIASNSASSPAAATISPNQYQTPGRNPTTNSPAAHRLRWASGIHSGSGGVPVASGTANNGADRQPSPYLSHMTAFDDYIDPSAYAQDEPHDNSPSVPPASRLRQMSLHNLTDEGAQASAHPTSMEELPPIGDLLFNMQSPFPLDVNEQRQLPPLQSHDFDSFGPALDTEEPVFVLDFGSIYPCPTIQQSRAGTAYPIQDQMFDGASFQTQHSYPGEAVLNADQTTSDDWGDVGNLSYFAGEYDAQHHANNYQDFVNDVDPEYKTGQPLDVDLSQTSQHRHETFETQQTAPYDNQYFTMENQSSHNHDFSSAGHPSQQQQDQPYQSIEHEDVDDQRCHGCGASIWLPHLTCYYDEPSKTSHFMSKDTNQWHLQLNEQLPLRPTHICSGVQAASPSLPAASTSFSPALSDAISARGPSQPVGARSVSLRPSSVYNRKTGTGKKFQCVDCVANKKERTWYVQTESTGAGRCKRDFEKFKKKEIENQPPDYWYDPAQASYNVAKDKIYGSFRPVVLRRSDDIQDDWKLLTSDEALAHWLARFIAAAVQPYHESDLGDMDDTTMKWLHDQQIAFNRARYEKTGGQWYTNDYVNARFVMLFYAVLNFHRGGERPYPLGGSNSGYGKIDDNMTCSERLEQVEKILKTDKRIVMNVIEGDHVCVLAENPLNVQKRKSSNKNTNLKKASLALLGKQAAAEAKGKEAEGDVDGAGFSDDEDAVMDDGDEEYVGGVGDGRKRRRVG